MLGSIVEISAAEFRQIADLVYTNFGINLTDKKISLVQGRLNKVLRRKGYDTFKDYFEELKADSSGLMLVELIDRISTNHTFFFREPAHFELLAEEGFKDLDERFLKGKADQLRIWCAGCATGEEAYTIAMLVRENFPSIVEKPGHPIILATDISTEALTTALTGVYDASRLEMVSKNLTGKYFSPTAEGRYEVKPALRNMILFKRLNFMDDNFPLKNRFHIIFCRNVMIYFDQETKDTLIAKFHKQLHSKGYFFIGHSETIARTNADFQFLAPAAYQRRE